MGIIDISKMPQVETPIAIDTNALIYAFYSKSSADPMSKYYSDFIDLLIRRNTEIIVTTFNLCELFHAIENIEMNCYNKTNKSNLKLKEYRKLPSALSFIKKEINLIYAQIEAISNVEIIDIGVSKIIVNNFIKDFDRHACDFFDFALFSYCNENGIPVLSHDGDFMSPSFKNDLYTANPRTLACETRSK